MRILNWNCNGAFRKKYEYLNALNADIKVIQECENPIHTKDSNYKNWAQNYLWVGDNKNKGLGVFANTNVKIELLDWTNIYNDKEVKYFLPVKINNQFQILAVWAHKNNSPNFGYIGQLWKYLQLNKSKFDNIIITGDFNSNTIWDEWDRWWNHSDVVKELEHLNIFSVYHEYYKEKQGKETIPTFYLQRKKEKPYHIDYFFSDKLFLNSIFNYSIESSSQWLPLSDHLPQIFELKT